MTDLGVMFGSELKSGRRGRRRGEETVEVARVGWTVSLFMMPLVCAFVVVVVRLVWLTVVVGKTYRELSDGNRVRLVAVRSPRGIIYDRNGRSLVVNRPLYKLREGGRDEVISRDKALELLALGRDTEVVEVVGREYLLGAAGAHVLGYIGEVGAEEISGGRYRVGDLVGRTGIEEMYDARLRGTDGSRLLEVDTGGGVVREMGSVAPKVGDELRLSLDASLQEIAYRAMRGQKGAVVVTNGQSGEVLALVSSPSFDPALFSGMDRGGGEVLSGLFTDAAMPLFNRAVGGLYPPGSTFKIVTGIAALESGVIGKDFRYIDVGFVKAGREGRVFSNWYFSQYGKTEGEIGLVRALARSTDTFFYKLGELLGEKNLAAWARKFGLGRRTGIDLPGELAGLVPDSVWKQEVKKEGWYLGDSMIMAIGQGNLLTTPIQINQMTGAVATGGWWCAPRLLRLPDGGRGDCREIGLSREAIEETRRGMRGACSAGGTAFPFFGYPSPQLKISVFCKTGTAEFGDPKGRTHAWFTAYLDEGEAGNSGREGMVITVVVEAGGEGSRVAAPIAREVISGYLGIEDHYVLNQGIGGE